MKHIAAYLLLQTGGNASPSASDIKTLLETVGVEADQAQLDKLISELDGKDINQVGSPVLESLGRQEAVETR
jgi:large subunit ribosomal protein LP2